MPAITFPNDPDTNPGVGGQHTAQNGLTYVWDGEKWESLGTNNADPNVLGILGGFRNLVINGAMQIAQRGEEVTSITDPGFRTCDRFRVNINDCGTWTVQQSHKSEDVNNAPDGFAESLRLLCTTAAPASLDAGAYVAFRYLIEGFDCLRLINTGTTTHPMRLSFWVKVIAAGSFPKTATVSLLQLDNSTRMFSTSYSISASDTWQRIVIDIPVDTAAAFDNDNGAGLSLDWWFNSGSRYTGGSHAAGWVAFDDTVRNATNLGLGQTVDDEVCITGVQLEVGPVATEFEHRPIGTELALCQRYFRKYTASNNGYSGIFTHTPVNTSGTGASETAWNCYIGILGEMRVINPSTLFGGGNTTRFDLRARNGGSVVAVDSIACADFNKGIFYITTDTDTDPSTKPQLRGNGSSSTGWFGLNAEL